jgi:hypothetical protein
MYFTGWLYLNQIHLESHNVADGTENNTNGCQLVLADYCLHFTQNNNNGCQLVLAHYCLHFTQNNNNGFQLVLAHYCLYFTQNNNNGCQLVLAEARHHMFVVSQQWGTYNCQIYIL